MAARAIYAHTLCLQGLNPPFHADSLHFIGAAFSAQGQESTVGATRRGKRGGEGERTGEARGYEERKGVERRKKWKGGKGSDGEGEESRRRG